jgi:CDP-glycerol:poly(glycerophosphate) glycerophosphotransferase
MAGPAICMKQIFVALLRSVNPALHRLDHAIGRLLPCRDVLVEMRTPVYHAVLGPIADALSHFRQGFGGQALEPGARVWYTSESPDRVKHLVPAGRFLTHEEAEWRRFDLYLNGDPWAPVRLRRCAHRINFFHGVAGKYDLDQPAGLPLGFECYDHVAFINRDRMLRYLAADIVTPKQAVLVGYPKLDALVSGAYDGAAVLASLGLRTGHRTALYAPTYSEASSLHIAGEEIVKALVGAGLNVIVKLHDRSLDPDPRYNGGIDWRARFAALEKQLGPERVRFVEASDASPLLAAADCMVTDHSSIGFEYLVLDRPLLVFDAPDLPRAARINPEKIVLLRSAASVVDTPAELAARAVHALGNPAHLSAARRRVARGLFFDPGHATERAVRLITGLLHPASPAAPVPVLVDGEEEMT